MSVPAEQPSSQDNGGAPAGAAASFWRRRLDAVWGPLSRTAWVQAIFNFFANNMGDAAAALTYQGLMSIFPGLLVVFSVFSLLGDPSVPKDAATSLLDKGTDPSTVKVVEDVLNQMIRASSGAVGVALVISLLLALNGASGAFQSAGRALNRVFGYEETRGLVRRRVVSLGATLLVVVLYVITVAAVFVGGDWARSLFDEIGLGTEAAEVWNVVRWLVAAAAAMLAVLLVYTVAPDQPARSPRLRLLSVGAVVAVLLWLGAAALFGVYVRNFSHYGTVYGIAGSLIVLMLFLYLTNFAFLYGAELNAERSRRRIARRGAPPFSTPPPTAEHPTAAAPVPAATARPDEP